MKRLAALVPNSLGVSPGQRVRIESWATYLEAAGWTVDFYPFEDAALHEILYAPGSSARKAAKLVSCYARQLRTVIDGPECDVLFVYREAAMIGPALIERLAARRRVPIVYDLDDPVFIPYRSPMNGWFSLLKFPEKTHTLFRLSNRIIAINNIIGQYASRYNPAVSIVPNCIDVERYKPMERPHSETVRLGWVGSHSTMRNLQSIAGPLGRLQSAAPTVLRIIGAGSAELPGVSTEVRQWSADSEIADLGECDIGLVPLPDHPWHPWKFFYKTIQYMALGLPVVARRMGSNSEIIEDGVNGFLVETEEEWYDRLLLLVRDRELRVRMGKAARTTIVERYSTQTQMPKMVSVFEQILQRPDREKDS